MRANSADTGETVQMQIIPSLKERSYLCLAVSLDTTPEAFLDTTLNISKVLGTRIFIMRCQ